MLIDQLLYMATLVINGALHQADQVRVTVNASTLMHQADQVRVTVNASTLMCRSIPHTVVGDQWSTPLGRPGTCDC